MRKCYKHLENLGEGYIYMDSLYFICNFSVSIKLFRNKKKNKEQMIH